MDRRAVIVVATWLFVACERDAVLSARRVLEEEPARAEAILERVTTERPDCFDCWLFLGLAREKGQDFEGAIEAYERALSLDEAGRRPEPVADRLLWLYQQVFVATTDNAVRTAIARKAAPIEVRIGSANPWANEFLYEHLLEEFRTYARARRRNEALAVARLVQSLYLSPEKKNAAAKEANAFLREEFARQGAETIRAKHVETLTEKGFLDKKGRKVVLRNDFRIPTRREDPSFDPSSDAFHSLVRVRACLPLRERLAEVVDLVREDLKVSKLSEADLDRLFATLFTYARAGYVRYGAEHNPGGQLFMCRIRVPIETFVAELFRFSERSP